MQIALLGYRAICYELYAKERDLASSDIKRDSDKGQPIHIQREVQEEISLHASGITKALKELKLLKHRYDMVLFEGRFDDLGYYIVGFDKNPSVMCSSTAQATHDFRGTQIHELGRSNIPANWLTFSLIATDDGGASVFSWPADHRKSEDSMRTFHALPDGDLPHAIIRYTFEFFENTYFSPEWWDNLEGPMQVSLMERQLRGLRYPRPDGCLSDDGIRAVDWQVVSRLTSIT